MIPLHHDPEKDASRPWLRWPIRVATDAAIIAVAVPMGLEFLCGPPARGFCADDAEHIVPTLGFWFLMARIAWPILKRMNDAAERWLDGIQRGRGLAKPWFPPDEL